MVYDIGLVTCAAFAELHAEDQPLIKAFEKLGLCAGPLIWGSDQRPRSGYLVRSTWDYHTQPEAFAGWLHSLKAAHATVWNSPSLMLWNMHKGYLDELQQRHLPVIPTRVVRRGESVERPDWDGELIAKPAIGAGARGALRGPWAAIRSHIELLHEEGDVLVQPYLRSVESYGERSLLFVEGKFTHAVRRTLALEEGQGLDRLMPRVDPTEAELSAAQAVLAALPEVPVYARIDLIANEEGAPRLLELELIEPRLFLQECPAAAQALAQACQQRLLSTNRWPICP